MWLCLRAQPFELFNHNATTLTTPCIVCFVPLLLRPITIARLFIHLNFIWLNEFVLLPLLVLCFARSRSSQCSYQFYCPFALTLIYYCTCYFMLCFVLFFASRRLSFITVCCCCWRFFFQYLLSVGCGKRLRTSTTLPHFNKENIFSTLIRTTNANYLHTDSLASAHSTLRFLDAPQKLAPSSGDAKRQNTERFLSNDNKLCDRNVVPHTIEQFILRSRSWALLASCFCMECFQWIFFKWWIFRSPSIRIVHLDDFRNGWFFKCSQ